MYSNVSDAFKAAIKQNKRKSTIKIDITCTDGKQYTIDDSSLIKDTFYIDNKCVNESKLNFGTVYAAECGFVFNAQSIRVDRYKMIDAVIVCRFGLRLPDGTLEYMPMGTYVIDTADRVGSKIKVTAVDNMTKFDTGLAEDTNGTWYELITYICNTCKVELAQTQEELEALHINVTFQTYTLSTERIGTYRDAISYLCSIICAFAYINRDNKLEIRQFATEVTDSNNAGQRLNNCSFSDYVTRYSAVTARFIKSENFYPYVSKDKNLNYLLLDMGDIPVVGGTPETKQVLLDNILATLKTIEYVPATLYIASNPLYDLGDLIQCDNINYSTDSICTYLMSYKYEYRKKETINCYGENPLSQSVKSKSDKQLSTIEDAINEKNIVSVHYSNASEYVVKTNLIDIVTLNYSISFACKPMIIATVPFFISCDGFVEFNVYNSLVAVENAAFTGYYQKGYNFATIFWYDDCQKGDRRSIRILARAYADTTSKVRVQDAEIATLKNAFTALKELQNVDLMCYDLSQWEQGTHTNGVNSDSVTRLRNSLFIPIASNMLYKCSASSYSYCLEGCLYDENHVYISDIFESWQMAAGEFKTPDNAKYIRFRIKKSDESVITTDALKDVYWNVKPDTVYETVAVDVTEPTVTITTQTIKAVAFAQGISGGAEWDGTLEFRDDFGTISIPSEMSVSAFNAAITDISQQVPMSSGIVELFGAISIPSEMSVAGFSESIMFSEVIKDLFIDARNSQSYVFDRDCVTSVDVFKLKTDNTYYSKDATIDSGSLSVLYIDTSNFTSVESVVIENDTSDT